MKTTQGSSMASSKPNASIGFTAILNGSAESKEKSRQTIHRALAHFTDLKQLTLEIGQTTLTIWGRGQLTDCHYRLPDNSVLVLIGSPSGNYPWRIIEENLLNASPIEPFVLPWEGRVILLRIDPIGNIWTLWNDWVGSIPVFHAQTPEGWVASTLEPVVVNALGLSVENISLPSLLALLMWGHYFSDWTLYKDMKALPPDCEATWDQMTFRYRPCQSVKPTDQRWQIGLDELIDEKYAQSKKAITAVLEERQHWTLPLSSGLDSRLIAGVAAEIGANIHAYTWGTPKTSDVIHARNISRSLGIPWKAIDPGNTYLKSDRQRGIDLFGSSMHFHGMYQMPFLDALKDEPPGAILSGFLGECLAGYDVKMCWEVNQGPHHFQHLSDGYLHWTIDELFELMSIPIQEALEELSAEYERMLNALSGALYQRLKFLTIWGRQRHFTYFQSMLCDYWRGVATPYINCEYARFSFSLPRATFDDRMLQRMMLARYFPKLAAIPGTYAREPALLTGSYLLKKRFAHYLPEKMARTVFPGLYRTKSNSDIACVQHDGEASFYPLFENISRLSPWMNLEKIKKTYENILAHNSTNAIRKLQSIQTFAYRLAEQGN